jgi:hypothetical protein
MADIANTDPNALYMAHKQAILHEHPDANTDPLAPGTANPNSPLVGANQGVNGGK